jgi:hypothetical protein
LRLHDTELNKLLTHFSDLVRYVANVTELYNISLFKKDLPNILLRTFTSPNKSVFSFTCFSVLYVVRTTLENLCVIVSS